MSGHKKDTDGVIPAADVGAFNGSSGTTVTEGTMWKQFEAGLTAEQLREKIPKGEEDAWATAILCHGGNTFIVKWELLLDSSATVKDLKDLDLQELLFEQLPSNGFNLACQWLEHWFLHPAERPWVRLEQEPPLPNGSKREYPERPLLKPLENILCPFDKDFVYKTVMQKGADKCDGNLLDAIHVANQLNIKPLHNILCAALAELFKKCENVDTTEKIFKEFLDEPMNEETWKKTIQEFPFLDPDAKKEEAKDAKDSKAEDDKDKDKKEEAKPAAEASSSS
eukprot:NODE_1917_length_1254_cov_127.169295_g1587_i0.p1 GENE.NODE_1917_length_1254_cov_127.169295_g1587_i0~~NODE_1917_length_1254_cov_127.169295_g1587_i0.p1  ORF type:complete len:281 (+),score=159.83 NODE_1917_length_1254_cov_127.169295_g1587_i0:100-942(+)